MKIPRLFLVSAILAASSSASADDGGRVYAAQCFQCHGTNGISVSDVDSLAGKSQKELIEKLREMKSKPDSGNIMHKHAKGWTDQQIRELAGYLSSVNQGSGN